MGAYKWMSAIKQYTQHLSSNVNKAKKKSKKEKIRTFREYCFIVAWVQCILYDTSR